jgi:hypothetical protein
MFADNIVHVKVILMALMLALHTYDTCTFPSTFPDKFVCARPSPHQSPIYTALKVNKPRLLNSAVATPLLHDT